MPQPTVPLSRLSLAWLILLGGLVGFWFVRPFIDAHTFNTGQIFILFWTSKIATLLCMDPAERLRLSWGRFIAYLFWPGMQPRHFLPDRPLAAAAVVPTVGGVLLNTFTGVVFLWVIPALLPATTPMIIRVWSALVGFFFLLTFVLVDVWAFAYRRMGFAVEKLWVCPIASTSLTEFWGQRWNRIFSGMLREVLFMPLARRVGVTVAMFAVFLYSGVLHENLTVAAASGYGGPTLYFVIQAAGTWLEGRRGFRRVLKGRPWLGWLWAFVVVVLPVNLLVQQGYLDTIMVPGFRILGVAGMPEAVPGD